MSHLNVIKIKYFEQKQKELIVCISNTNKSDMKMFTHIVHLC